jgi:DNA-binding transcriptional regulator YbjK
VIFTLTNGFKDLDNLVQSAVRKETRKSLRELEHVLSNTSRNADGNLTFFSGASGEVDPESKIGLSLDI